MGFYGRMNMHLDLNDLIVKAAPLCGGVRFGGGEEVFDYARSSTLPVDW